MTELKLKIVPDLSDVEKQFEKAGVIKNKGTEASEETKLLKQIRGSLLPIGVAVGVIAAFWSSIGPIVNTVFRVLGLLLFILLMPFLKLFLPLLRTGIPFLINLTKSIADFIGDLLEKMKLPEAFEKLAEGDVLGFFFTIFEGISGVGASIFEWISENLPAWLSVLANLGQGFLDWISEHIDEIMDAWPGLGEFILGWVEENLPVIMDAVLEIGGALLDWVEENRDTIIGVLAMIGDTIFNFFVKNLPRFLAVLLGLGEKILLWFLKRLPQIFGILLNLGFRFFSWIVKKIPDIFGLLLDLGVELFNAIVDTATKGFGVLASLGKDLADAIISWVIGQFGNLFGDRGGTTAQDFIMRPGQPPLHFSSSDTVVGFKGGAGGLGTTVNYSPTYNVGGGVDNNSLKRLFEEHDRNFLNRLRSAGTAGGRIFNA